MDFSCYEYKRKNEHDSESIGKKARNDEIIDEQFLHSPNILVFHAEVFGVSWIISDASGDYLDKKGKTSIDSFVKVLQIANENGCSIVTYDIKSQACLFEKDVCQNVFCLLEQSFIRSGLTKIDGKLKVLSCEDIYYLLHNEKIANVSKCETILKCFVSGRIKGWF
jgi:hypothetical protein